MSAIARNGSGQSQESHVDGKDPVFESPPVLELSPRMCVGRKLESGVELELKPRDPIMRCGLSSWIHCTKCASPNNEPVCLFNNCQLC